MRTIAFFWQYFKRYKLSFVVVLLMMITATVFQVLFPVYVGQAVQHLVELGRAFAEKGETDQILSTFGSVMGSVLVSFVCLSVSSLIYMLLMTRVIAHSTNEMRKGLFGKLSKMTVAFFDRHQDGDILSRFTSDLDNILQALNESMIQVMSNALLYLGLVIIMFVQNARLAWITVASTPVAFLLLVVIVRLLGNTPIFSKKKSAASMLIWTRPFQVRRLLSFRECRRRSSKDSLSRMTEYA